MKSLSERMTLYMDAGFPIIYIETFEEDKAERAVVKASSNREILEWNVRGLFYSKVDEKREGISLLEALNNFANPDAMDNDKFARRFSLKRRVLLIKDAQELLDVPEITAQLKFLSEQIVSGELPDANIVILSPRANVPKALEHYVTMLTVDYLSTTEIKDIILDFCEKQDIPAPLDDFLRELSLAFKGLPEFEIINILSLALADNGEIGRSDLKLIHDQKKQLVQKSGIMEMVAVREKFSDIGGLENLKNWLTAKAKVLKNIDKAQAYGVDLPKGVLIAGLPGCGKSLNAKAAAALFDVPLLRMDMGRLMGKYVGESEANMRHAIALAEAISPCVLWIDELEKAFAGIGAGGGGNEVTTRLFGTFLTWMQEKDGLAFVVATANNITHLPPELLRKGRFDEIFYVGLPSPAERAKIFEIHIGRRRPKDLAHIDIAKLAKATEGYSGADIEGVVKDAIELSFTNDLPAVSTDTILQAIRNTASLSVIMKEQIEKMSKEYKDRHFKNASI
ncbi:AAA family ATPase [Selenomonas ruminantium]|uniref:AAA family ATPase n=1 Tax=Selenomonas ruminantium TaxID=971 RepID=UPI0026EA0201|nr:AAA family ATPase [Selenomonas ruminantium]